MTADSIYPWLDFFRGFGELSEGRRKLIEAKDTQHQSFSHLKPGDLVFWAGTYEPTDGRLTKITHVAIFLGHEKKDGRAVMINATNGRPYRGAKVDGYGVCDFRVPRKDGKSRMVGYGTPPGLAVK